MLTCPKPSRSRHLISTRLPYPMALLCQIVDPITALTRPADGPPQGALVLLHGRGSSEHDLVDLFDLVDPERRLVGITPRAPLALPPGGRHWYALREIGYPDPATFLATMQLAGEWLDGLAESTGVPLERTVLGGFSQGCVMSWALGLAAGRQRPGRHHRPVRVHAHGRGFRARPGRPHRLSGGDRPRHARLRDQRGLGEACARPHGRPPAPRSRTTSRLCRTPWIRLCTRSSPPGWER